MIVLLAVSAIGAGLASDLLTNRSVFWSRTLKILASSSMVAIIFTGSPTINAYTILITAGLIASWFGDLALSYKGKKAFVAGLISFALAHALYTVGFFARSTLDLVAVALSALVVALGATAVLRWLSPYIPDRLRLPVFIYMGIIAVMVVTAVGTGSAVFDPRIPIAATLFALSDILVARQLFVTSQIANRVVGLTTYYAAQVLFAITVIHPWV